MKTSCGIIILNENNEILMGHVTGNKFYDIPKGLQDENEEPIACAIRECQEEISLVFEVSQLTDLGRFAYNKEKNLHFFLTHVNKDSIKIEELFCDSFFEHHYTKKQTPEVDGFKWIPVKDVVAHCAKSMGNLLTLLAKDGAFNKKPTLRP
jgi:putative (di)nucleoside polyphosphate hydrolase